MDPGPLDPSVLRLQHRHRSQLVWDSQQTSVLRIRGKSIYRLENPDSRIKRRLRGSGFEGCLKLANFARDPALITALVERWREETHTFHLAVGEATVTLEDVQLIMGLPTDGLPVTGRDVRSIMEMEHLCYAMLGHIPQGEDVQAGRIKISWLESTFEHLPEGADDIVVQQHTRAWLLQLMGNQLFPDHSNVWVLARYLYLMEDLDDLKSYSWGSAVLARLYRELCMACRGNAKRIGGYCTLLQLWVWERLPMVRPRQVRDLEPREMSRGPLGCRWPFNINYSNVSTNTVVAYRDQLDRQEPGQMIWTPYQDDLVDLLPDYCFDGAQIWFTMSPLICYEVVEWYRPERVHRQFGMRQTPPPTLALDEKLHNISRKLKAENWAEYHEQYVQLWGDPDERIMEDDYGDDDHWHDDYMQWFSRITRRFINPPERGGPSRFHGAGSQMEILSNVVRGIVLEDDRTVHDHDRIRLWRKYAQLSRSALNEIDSGRFGASFQPQLQVPQPDPMPHYEPVCQPPAGPSFSTAGFGGSQVYTPAPYQANAPYTDSQFITPLPYQPNTQSDFDAALMPDLFGRVGDYGYPSSARPPYSAWMNVDPSQLSFSTQFNIRSSSMPSSSGQNPYPQLFTSDTPQEVEEEDEPPRQDRPRRQTRGTRCGTGSHYFRH